MERLTKKWWVSLPKEKKIDYIYTIGVESTWSRRQAIARDKELEKIKKWELEK